MNKWTTEKRQQENKKLLVCLFTSRNKDNKDMDGFVPRRQSFVVYEHDPKIYTKFNEFVNQGLPGELSRLYLSVNARDEEMVRKHLLEKLIFDQPDLTRMDPLIASIAAKKEFAKERHWLFDFDSKDESRIEKFIEAIHDCSDSQETQTYPTPNGFAVVTKHGFDTRSLLKDFPEATLKRDAMLCTFWNIKAN